MHWKLNMFPNFCPSKDGPHDPLSNEDGSYVTCDALTKAGCPEGYNCVMSVPDLGPNKKGFCCPVFDCIGVFGVTYQGTTAFTEDGLLCQAWNETTPTRHVYTDDAFFYEGVDEARNYCRNPDRDTSLDAWCYSTMVVEGENPLKTCGLPNCNTFWAEFLGPFRHSSGLCLEITDNNWGSLGPTCHKMTQVAAWYMGVHFMFPYSQNCLIREGFFATVGSYLAVTMECATFYNAREYETTKSMQEIGGLCWNLIPYVNPYTGLSDKSRMDIVLGTECATIRQEFNFITITQDDCPDGVEKQICQESICDDASCGHHGEATCFINGCGTCSPVFLDMDNVKVNCSASPSKCERHKTRQERLRRLSTVYDAEKVFVPSCLVDGSYNTTQCQDQKCWCVDESGMERSGTQPPLCDKWTTVSVDVVLRLDQPYLYVRNSISQFTREVITDLSSKFWIAETIFTSVSVSEVTELIFTMKPVKQGIPAPEDIASLAYRIEVAVEDGKYQFEYKDHMFMVESGVFTYNPYVVPPPEKGGNFMTTLIVAVVVPIVIILLLGLLILKATKKNKAVKRRHQFTEIVEQESTSTKRRWVGGAGGHGGGGRGRGGGKQNQFADEYGQDYDHYDQCDEYGQEQDYGQYDQGYENMGYENTADEAWNAGQSHTQFEPDEYNLYPSMDGYY